MTTEARYESRAATAEDRYERLLTMLRQTEEMLRKAMKAAGAPLDEADLMIALAEVPPLGISAAADRCRVAEENWLHAVGGVLEDLAKLIENAERLASKADDGFIGNGFDERFARKLAELRSEAGVSAEDVAAAISDPDEQAFTSGYVEGVEDGRYGLRWAEVDEWAVLCGSSLVEVYEAVTGEVLTEERWPLFLRNRVAA